ncbi:MAG: PAS domain S-box protein, partial [bacterium]|nr:PAS domain S-box protein [bacterium]
MPPLLHRPASARPSRLTAWLVLVLGLLLTGTVTMHMASSVTRLAELDFDFRCATLQNTIACRLDDHARILLSGAALFNASTEVTREEWQTFTQYQNVEKQLPGIQGFGFALLIPRAELSRHVQAIRAQGFPAYTVKPAGDRGWYSAIIYLQPFSGRNLRAFGYDMLSEPVRRAAMERARDTDAAALSGPVVLVQETAEDVHAGTLMYVPVYRKNMPTATVAQRRAALHGWVYSPYRMGDLIQGILGGRDLEQEQQLHLAVFDGAPPAPQGLLYACHPAADAPRWPAVHFTRQLAVDFNGHGWTLCFTQTGGGFFTAAYTKAWQVLVGGTCITLLLFALIRILMNTRNAAQRMAAALTGDLRKSEEQYRFLIEHSHDIIYTLTADGVFTFVSPAWTTLLGHPVHQVIGQPFQQFVHADDLPDCLVFMRSVIETGQRQEDLEYRVQHCDGTWHWHTSNAVPLRDEARAVIGFVGTARDITERKRAEDAVKESEANSHTFFETVTDMIMVGTPDGRLLLTNAAVTRTLGYSAAELQGMHLLDLHPAAMRAEAAAIIAAVFRGERDICPLPLACKDGRLVPVETRIWLGRWNGADCIFGISKNLTIEQNALQRFERLFRNNPALMALSTLPAHRFVDVNDAFLKALGYSWNEVIGKTVAELGLFANPAQQSKVVAQLLADGHLAGSELQVRCKDGTLRDGLFSGDVITSQGRQYYLTVMTDITARKQAEEALRAAQQITEGIINAIPARVFWKDKQLVYLGCNAAFARDAGFADPHDIIGKDDYQMGWRDRAELYRADDRQVLESGCAKLFIEEPQTTPAGHILTLLTSKLPLRNAAGEISGVLGTYMDITERKRAEVELLKMQKLQSVGTLAGGIAHDFNNILTAVFGNITLAKDVLAEEHPGHALLEDAEKSMQRAARLTKQLLTFAKGGAPVKEDVSLVALVEEVARFDLSGSKIRLVYQHATDLWLADVDKGQIQQVISNLVINARQAMPAGGFLHITLDNAVVPAAAIAGLAPGNYVKVSVRDEGSGIDPQDLARIFDPYFTTKQTGSGLGLATAYSIIHQHGGHLGVVSEPGTGSTFTFYLPIAAPPPQAATLPDAAVYPPLNRPARVLMMDDETTLCDIVARMLIRHGFAVAIAPDGDEALLLYQQAQAAGAPFDVVIMDLTIPGGMGGE